MAITEKNGTMKYKDSAGNLTIMYPKTRTSQVEGLDAAIEEAKPFVVTIQRSTSPDGGPTFTADKTYAEIRAAFNAGKCCYAIVPGLGGSSAVFFLFGANAENVQFAATSIEDAGHIATMTITITSNNAIESAIQSTQKPILVTGIVKGIGDGVYSAAVAGTDYAAAEHNHSAGDINSGVFPIERGGTGAGTVAQARTNLGAAAKQTVVPITLTVAGWNASTKRQVATVTGVLADYSKQKIEMAFSSEAAILAYAEAGILAVAQGANSLTFQCSTVPTEAIAVNIIIQEL